MKTKKMNSYKKLGLVLLASAIAGAVLGLIGAIAIGFGGESIKLGMTALLTGLQKAMVPLLIVVTVISVIYGELSLKKHREIGRKILETEDEECDRWEYEEEKNSAKGMIVNILSQIFCFLLLSVGYSMAYISDGNAPNMLAACAVFIICYAYDGVWQVRYVKQVQRIYPEKQGDPVSRKFQEQWLNSCDEAERTLIYQSAYKSYCVINKWIPAFLIITMLGQMFFQTGMLAIVVVAIIWLVVSVSYLRTCVKLREQKIKN